MTRAETKERLIVVSNRLPVTLKCTRDDTYSIHPSSGGLVTGLSGLAKSELEYRWYGWPGMEVPKQHISCVRDDLLYEHDAVPVLLDNDTAAHYYDGFSNSTLWPLLHSQLDKVSFDEDTFAAYRRANEVFADTIAPDLRDGDHVWVQDYHLMLLPLLLRQRAKMANIKIRIGWFLHTPFPDESIFSILPSKTEILNGILGADVIGFQTKEARRQFHNVCSRDFDSRPEHRKIVTGSREVSVDTFPIGIEPSAFHDRLRTEPVQDMIHSMRARFHGAKVIVGVDRLDYIKGVPQKLHAFDKFLEQYPEWVGRTTLVQLIIPSRANLDQHQKLLADIQKLVGEINGKYGRINYVPVQFLYSSLAPDELTALYTTADICFVSSTRDGMNLVSYEYVACHDIQATQASRAAIAPGALILSQFTGAADVLDGALIVNPWDRGACAEAIAKAVTMNDAQAYIRMSLMGDKVEEQTSSRWVSNFLRALAQSEEEEKRGSGDKADIKRVDSGLSEWNEPAEVKS